MPRLNLIIRATYFFPFSCGPYSPFVESRRDLARYTRRNIAVERGRIRALSSTSSMPVPDLRLIILRFNYHSADRSILLRVYPSFVLRLSVPVWRNPCHASAEVLNKIGIVKWVVIIWKGIQRPVRLKFDILRYEKPHFFFIDPSFRMPLQLLPTILLSIVLIPLYYIL